MTSASMPSSFLHRWFFLGLLAIGACLLVSSASAATAFADFGIASFDGQITDENGDTYTQAGGHPFAASTTIDLNQTTDDHGNPTPDGSLKGVSVGLPAGFVGDPNATPTKCTAEQLQAGGDIFASANCPASSQIGTTVVQFKELGPINEPVYNMIPPPGLPAQLGFKAVSAVVHLNPTVRTGGDYGLTVNVNDISQGIPIFGSSLTVWGVPADPAHDGERGSCLGLFGPTGEQCPTDAPRRSFITNPTACTPPGVGLETTLHADSWQGESDDASFFSHLPPGPPTPGPQQGPIGCDRLAFDPSITVQPTSHAADSPTGLHVELSLPQNENPDGLAEAHLKKATVQLPAGMAVNPSAADGLAACNPAQIDLSSPNPATCPDASKVGTVEVDTPLLDHPLDGAVYLAAQNDNPFNSLLAIYIAVEDPQTGIVVKLAGKVESDPQTGRLRTTFDDNPQLPFSDFKLDLFGGSRAQLITPPSCGSFTATADLSPWSAADPNNPTPAEVAERTSAFAITSGPDGGPCPPGDFKPSFEAATVTPLAGSYSPLVVKASRPNGSQLMRGLNLNLPPGLTGKLAGIATCPDSSLTAAAASRGIAELSTPSCPAASRLGDVDAGVGAGPTPFHVPGSAYLAGPYKGAPLSIAVITPAVAGPFDLGTVVVRTAARIDPGTAQIHVQSDQLPTILQGIPLDLRSVAVAANRNRFTLNPTSCDPMSLDGTIFGSPTPAAVASRFQVGGCKGLDFAPRLSLKVKGGTKRGAHPALRAVLRAKPGEADIAKTEVALPHSEFLDQAHIKTVCTRVQFTQDSCPAGSVYGHARAITPLLDYAIEGPVYLRSSSHELPDLVAALRGPARQPIEINLDGRIDSVNGGIRNSFEAVPDAPVSKFVLTMQGAKKGLLVNSTNLCAQANRATAKFDGQNGKVHDFNPLVKNSCAK
ncbi:MAG TPA: hypothetical protein VHU14_03625 [Solirubrobacterales bacterium]|nr:hypothetical protein [Solirubrobacterales bacterium]